MATFESNFNIGDNITFIPMCRQTHSMKIKPEEMYGTIIAVRFTKAKIMYDICDEYYGKIFKKVDSIKVFGIKQVLLEQSEN